MAIINAILGAANIIAGGQGGTDSVNKPLDALKGLLLPHWNEEKEDRAKKVKEVLEKEMAGGPIKVQVVGKDVRR